MLTEALSLQPPLDDTGPEHRKNCSNCESVGTVTKNHGHVYENKSLKLSMNAPAYICSNCDVVIYEPATFKDILQAEEVAQGRHYVKVELKNGRIVKYSVH